MYLVTSCTLYIFWLVVHTAPAVFLHSLPYPGIKADIERKAPDPCISVLLKEATQDSTSHVSTKYLCQGVTQFAKEDAGRGSCGAQGETRALTAPV
ncbi:hypothetical protein BGX38DRAFT_379225 [Terfezia claveryi]|nr:hypothetical protein BGX38DRAFT_379225 [Terfezia claveryi]